MNCYNGFSPRERRAWNGVERPAPQRCSVCGCGPERPPAYHGVDYRDRDSVYAICARCHHAIHMRFRRPDHWQRTIAALDPAGWFQSLSVDPGKIWGQYIHCILHCVFCQQRACQQRSTARTSISRKIRSPP